MNKNDNNTAAKKKNLDKYQSQYSEAKLSSKIARFAKSAGMECVYYVLLLVSIMKSKEVPLGDKAIIVGALGYFISPLDLIPDLMIGTGYIDDAGMLLYALNTISSRITPSIRKDAINSLHKYFDFRDEEFQPKI